MQTTSKEFLMGGQNAAIALPELFAAEGQLAHVIPANKGTSMTDGSTGKEIITHFNLRADQVPAPPWGLEGQASVGILSKRHQ
jgi:hypothetical protein